MHSSIRTEGHAHRRALRRPRACIDGRTSCANLVATTIVACLVLGRILAPVGDAVAYVRVRPGPKSEPSIIHCDLYVDAKGVMGWFVSEKTLREKQEAMTVRYLNDLHRAFTRDSQRTTQ